MTLDRGAVGSSYTVERMDLPAQVEHRLEALGMTLGRGITRKIEVL